MDLNGTIFDIQHFSLHDGPGVRSTIFFKGCPLHCPWCSNPESQKHSPEILHYKSQCRQCGACLSACPRHALSLVDKKVIRSGDCRTCGACVAACPGQAHVLSGRQMDVAQICAEVREHWRIFMQSQGGVTCGGGEPMAQFPFLLALLRELHENVGFNTCMETCGFAPWEHFEAILPYLDELYVDIKHMDSVRHKAATGRDNALILGNIARLAARGKDLTIRVPLVPGYNDDDANILALAAFMRENSLSRVELMPMHVYGRSKYEALGRSLAVDDSRPPRADAAASLLSAQGICAEIQRL